ncbi:MAG: phosphoglycerate kinase [Candidatus Omnitrophota bacterium]|jgi:3-phosphoglycerate kinase
MWRKVSSVLISLCLVFQQLSFASVATELNLAGHLSKIPGAFTAERFRPVHIRFFSYDALNDNIKVMLDKGDAKNLKESQISASTQELLNYFLVGVNLPNDKFWVNLRPDSEDSIIDDYLARTDVGKIMLEADLQLKKDTAQFTSPQTPEGKEYWSRLYQKAEELYGYQEVSIPTLTRPWIVPNEIIVRESKDSAYIYKATLKVMLEQDFLKDSATYNFKDSRAKALNEYSSQLIRELIIPKLTKEVNLSQRYAALRQVYYSLVLSRWFKSRFANQAGKYASRIDRKDLSGLLSATAWSKSSYFEAYKKSFAQGEYNIKETVRTPTGQVIRSYFSGGMDFATLTINGAKTTSSPMTTALMKAGLVAPPKMAPVQENSKLSSSPIIPIIDQLNSRLKDKKVLLRVDFNVSNAKGQIKDTIRIEQAIRTIMYIIENGGTPILISHNGRPGGKVVKEFSLEPIAQKLQELLRSKGYNTEVIFQKDSITEQGLASGLKERIVLNKINLLENTRFCPGDESNDDAFSRALAGLADVYVFDAFGTAERVHASTGGAAKYMKTIAFGYLMEKETRYLEGALPVLKGLIIGGGPKVSEKVPMVMRVMNNIRAGGFILMGTGPVAAFLKLKYNIDIGQKPSEQDLKDAQEIIRIAQEKGIEIVLPEDFIAVDRNLAEKVSEKSWLDLKILPEGTNTYEVTLAQLQTGYIIAPDGEKIPSSDLFVYDVGPRTVAAFSTKIANVEARRSIFWNGSLGVDEMPNFQSGAIGLAQALTKATEKGVITVVGGGDTANSAKKYQAKVSHISTGGGASLAVLQGKKLKAIAALEEIQAAISGQESASSAITAQEFENYVNELTASSKILLGNRSDLYGALNALGVIIAYRNDEQGKERTEYQRAVGYLKYLLDGTNIEDLSKDSLSPMSLLALGTELVMGNAQEQVNYIEIIEKNAAENGRTSLLNRVLARFILAAIRYIGYLDSQAHIVEAKAMSERYSLNSLEGVLARSVVGMSGDQQAVGELKREITALPRDDLRRIPVLAGLVAIADTQSASSAITDNSKKGGIDFRSAAMVINYQPMGNFASLNPKLPVLSKIELASFDIDKELSGMEKLVNNQIVPSGERIKEVLAACSQKGEMEVNKERLMALLVKIGIVEETQCCLQEASNEYKEALVLADSLA